MLRLDPDQNLVLDEQDSLILNSTTTTPRTTIEILTESYVNSFLENNRSRRKMSTVVNEQDKMFDSNKLTNLHSISGNSIPILDNELANKKHVDDLLGEGSILRFDQTLQNYLKVSDGDTLYNLEENDKIQTKATPKFRELYTKKPIHQYTKKWTLSFTSKEYKM